MNIQGDNSTVVHFCNISNLSNNFLHQFGIHCQNSASCRITSLLFRSSPPLVLFLQFSEFLQLLVVRMRENCASFRSLYRYSCVKSQAFSLGPGLRHGSQVGVEVAHVNDRYAKKRSA